MLPDFLPGSANKLGYARQPPTGRTPPPASRPVKPPTPPPDDLMNGGKGNGQELAPGKVPADEQLLQMNNERFTVPEVLFNPSTIGERHVPKNLSKLV